MGFTDEISKPAEAKGSIICVEYIYILGGSSPRLVPVFEEEVHRSTVKFDCPERILQDKSLYDNCNLQRNVIRFSTGVLIVVFTGMFGKWCKRIFGS
jgi:hypothetical protein